MRIIDQTGWTTSYANGATVIYNPGSGLWESYAAPGNKRTGTHDTREDAEQAVGGEP